MSPRLKDPPKEPPSCDNEWGKFKNTQGKFQKYTWLTKNPGDEETLKLARLDAKCTADLNSGVMNEAHDNAETNNKAADDVAESNKGVDNKEDGNEAVCLGAGVIDKTVGRGQRVFEGCCCKGQ